MRYNGRLYRPPSKFSLLISINNKLVSARAYSVRGSQLIFSRTISPITRNDRLDFIRVLSWSVSITTPADGTVTTDSIVDGAVTEPKLADDAVTARTIKDRVIGFSHITQDFIDQFLNLARLQAFLARLLNTPSAFGDNVVGSRALAPNAVGTDHIQDDAVTEDKLADDAVTTNRIKDATITAAKFARGAVSQAATPDNSISTIKLMDGAVTEPKLADYAVSSQKIRHGAITTVKLDDHAVTAEKLSPSALDNLVDQVRDNSIQSSHLVDNAVTERVLASFSVTNDKIYDRAITFSKLSEEVIYRIINACNAVEQRRIADGAVTEDKLADFSVTEDKLFMDAVTHSKLACDAVETDNIKDKAVTRKKLADDAIGADALADGSVTTVKLGDSAVTDAKLADGAVTHPKLAVGSSTDTGGAYTGAPVDHDNIRNEAIRARHIPLFEILGDRIQDGAIDQHKLASNSILGAHIQSNAIQPRHLSFTVPSARTFIPNVAGAVETRHLALSAVTTITIGPDAVTEAKLADNAVSTDKIVDNAVTTAKLAGRAVTVVELADNAVITPKLARGAVTTAKLAGRAVTTPKLGDDAVTTPKLADDAVTNDKIATGAVESSHILSEAVTDGKIQPGSVKSYHLATNSVQETHIHDRSVKTRHLDYDAVTEAKIADDAVTGDQIKAGVVTEAHLAFTIPDTVGGTPLPGSVITAHLADGAITHPKLASGTSTDTGGPYLGAPVDDNNIRNQAVKARHLTPGIIERSHLAFTISGSGGGTPADGSVTHPKLSEGTDGDTGGAYQNAPVDHENIRNAAVRARHIQNDAIKFRHIDNNAVLEDHIQNGAVSHRKLSVGRRTDPGGAFTAAAVRHFNIQSDALQARHFTDNCIRSSAIDSISIATRHIQDRAITGKKLADDINIADFNLASVRINNLFLKGHTATTDHVNPENDTRWLYTDYTNPGPSPPPTLVGSDHPATITHRHQRYFNALLSVAGANNRHALRNNERNEQDLLTGLPTQTRTEGSSTVQTLWGNNVVSKHFDRRWSTIDDPTTTVVTLVETATDCLIRVPEAGMYYISVSLCLQVRNVNLDEFSVTIEKADNVEMLRQGSTPSWRPIAVGQANIPDEVNVDGGGDDDDRANGSIRVTGTFSATTSCMVYLNATTIKLRNINRAQTCDYLRFRRNIKTSDGLAGNNRRIYIKASGTSLNVVRLH